MFISKLDQNINCLFFEVDNYAELKNRILSNELERLSTGDRQAFFSYLAKREIFQKAANENDYELLEKLLAAGFEIDSIDSEFFKTLHNKPKIFRLCMKYERQANLLPQALSFYKDQPALREEWLKIFIELLPKAKSSDFKSFDRDQLVAVIDLVKQNDDVAHAIKPLALSLIEENPEETLRIMKVVFAYFDAAKYLLDLLNLIKKSYISDALKEKLFTSSEFLLWNFDNPGIFHQFEKIWKPNWVSGDFRTALFFKGLLNSQTLKEAAIFLHSSDRVEIPSEGIKAQIASHIQSLQKKEQNSIWNTLKVIKSESLYHILKLGLNPMWQDPNGRNLFFTRTAEYLKKEWLFSDLSHRDVKGHNALEYHCRKPPDLSAVFIDHAVIKTLSKELGMTLSKEFPFARISQELFPENPYHQAVLASCLNHPRKIFILRLLHNLDDKESFKKKINENTQLPQPAKKYILKALNPVEKEKSLCRLPPFDKLSIINSSISKPFNAEAFLSDLTPDAITHLYHHFFENPESFQKILQFYFKVKSLELFSGGAETTTHENFVGRVATQLGTLRHIKQSSSQLPEGHQNLVDSFQRITPSIPKEGLELPPNAKLNRLNRTVIVDESHAFKFLLPGEKYDYFSQEHSVTKAFQALKDQFTSTFHQPLGIYQIRQLPKELKEMESQLGHGPYYVYHYEGVPGTFKYMEELPLDSFFPARQKYLQDAAKMVKLGIYPDITSLFHNAKQKRKYLLLLNLAAYFIKNNGSNSPSGGAGRLDQPFEKKRYANARESGLTDLRDAMNFYGPGKLQITGEIRGMPDKETVEYQFFHQMYGLSNLLLCDMLFLTDKYSQNGMLNWQDDSFVEEFGNQLALAFAKVVAAYAEQPEKQARHFSKNCGIDWNMAAKQIAFWSDNTKTGYPSWVAKNTLPKGLYSESTNLIIDAEKSTNFDPNIGYNTEGIQDLGPFNGPLGLTEFERAMYLLHIPLVLAEEKKAFL